MLGNIVIIATRSSGAPNEAPASSKLEVTDMRTIEGVIKDIEYFDTSRNGNNRYEVTIGGVKCFTGIDSMTSYEIKKHEGKEVTASVRVLRGKLTITEIER
jgi:hypothetical protein